MLALVDAGETRFATGALRRHGVRAETVEELAWHGVFVCERDLEDVLIRALGPAVVREELAGLAELTAFRTFAQMPQWRDRPGGRPAPPVRGFGLGPQASASPPGSSSASTRTTCPLPWTPSSRPPSPGSG